MLSAKQAENLKMPCTEWLEVFLKSRGPIAINQVYESGKEKGFTRAQIKAVRAWHGKWIATLDGARWMWDNG